MSYLKKWSEFIDDIKRQTESKMLEIFEKEIKEALSKEIEMVDNIRDILVEYEDMGHDIQIWLYLIGNGITPFHIRFDKEHDVDYSQYNSSMTFKAIDEYTSVSINIDFLDHDPKSSGTKEDDEIADFLENFPKRIKSEYPFVKMKRGRRSFEFKRGDLV